jgi:hypothetical protein
MIFELEEPTEHYSFQHVMENKNIVLTMLIKSCTKRDVSYNGKKK